MQDINEIIREKFAKEIEEDNLLTEKIAKLMREAHSKREATSDKILKFAKDLVFKTIKIEPFKDDDLKELLLDYSHDKEADIYCVEDENGDFKEFLLKDFEKAKELAIARGYNSYTPTISPVDWFINETYSDLEEIKSETYEDNYLDSSMYGVKFLSELLDGEDLYNV